MAVFSDEIATAVELVTENGAAITVRRVTPGAPPLPEMPWKRGVAATDVFDAVGVMAQFGVSKVNGTNILTGDKQVIMSPFTDGTGAEVILDGNDVIVDAFGTPWSIVDINRIAPNDVETVLYIVQVRR